MNKKILELVIGVAVTAFVTFFISLGLDKMTSPKITINISESSVTPEGNYITNINILNFSNSNITNSILHIPTKIDVKNILSSAALQIETIPNNIGINNSSSFNIVYIPKKQNISMYILSNNKLDTKLVTIMNNESTMAIEYLNGSKSPTTKSIPNHITTALIYAFYLLANIYLVNKINEKHKQNMRLEIEQAEKETASLKQTIDYYKDMLDEQKLEQKKIGKKVGNLQKQKIYYRSKLYDYSKELNFWRNTIRKIMYKSEKQEINSDTIFQVVTKQLNTYSTNENVEFDYESLKVISNLLKEENE